MDPEPVRRVSTDSSFKRAVDVAHDVGGRARMAVFVRRDFVAQFQPPLRGRHPETKRREKFGVITQR